MIVMTLDTLASIANIGSFFLALFVAWKANEIKNILNINSNDNNSVSQKVNARDIKKSKTIQKNGN